MTVSGRLVNLFATQGNFHQTIFADELDLLAGVEDIEARQIVEAIRSAASPEEAARIGRSNQRERSHLVRPDWETAKLFVMYAGLQVKVPPPHYL